MEQEKRIQVSFSLTQEAYDNLENIARLKNISMNQVMNIILSHIALVPLIENGTSIKKALENPEELKYVWFMRP